ncbi:MAG: hypothetical protein LBT66_09400 [Methanobrevibacter sp.]|jgi:hypothetical protein|nr:hypothetical protein [Candidatus Methanovirga meridionalis]
MINIRGYRVEPSEVENVLLKVDGISYTAVLGFDTSKITGIDNDMELYAGYVSDKTIDENNIINELKSILPDYMIPLIIKKIDSIPLNDRGKIDRKNVLPDNVLELYKRTVNKNKRIVKPTNKTEEDILDLVSKQIGVKKHETSIDVNLLSTGFNSLSLASFVYKIESKTHYSRI